MSSAESYTPKAGLGYQSFEAFGMRIDAIDIPTLVALFRRRIEQREVPGYAVFHGMHPVVEARRNPKMMKACREANYVVPDGMPLVWLARLRGIPMARRCYGPEFLEEFCKATGASVRHYFFGSTPEVLTALTAKLQAKFGINIVGICSPPFTPPSSIETAAMIKRINDAQPDIIWVGLGAPKQEIWANEHLHLLKAPAIAPVGAAFDFYAGTKSQAPRWMREHGLEWLFRLITEPRRLAKRYVVYGSYFVCLLIQEEWARLRMRKTS